MFPVWLRATHVAELPSLPKLQDVQQSPRDMLPWALQPAYRQPYRSRLITRGSDKLKKITDEHRRSRLGATP